MIDRVLGEPRLESHGLHDMEQASSTCEENHVERQTGIQRIKRPVFRLWRGWSRRGSGPDLGARRHPLLDRDAHRSADTHLIRLSLPALQGIEIYLKDESTHRTGSLKHRLARSLILYGLCNGHIGPNTTLVEASSGSTAISEAYFARQLGLKFVAVMTPTTSANKIEAVERYEGRCHFVDHASQVYDAARQIADDSGGYYLDQFTYAERTTDWRSNNNIAETIFSQMAQEPHPVPSWIVMSAGTRGFIRYRGFDSRLCVVDPEHSVFYDNYLSDDCALKGTGRYRVDCFGDL